MKTRTPKTEVMVVKTRRLVKLLPLTLFLLRHARKRSAAARAPRRTLTALWPAFAKRSHR